MGNKKGTFVFLSQVAKQVGRRLTIARRQRTLRTIDTGRGLGRE
jgi:hypothetical protein